MPYLNQLPWQQAEKYFRGNDTVLFPIGCIHAHDHIPLGIDQLSVEYLCREIEKKTGLLVVPTLPFGWMEQYRDYPGTVNLTSDTLMRVVFEISSELCRWGVRKILFINGHGGNTTYLEEVGVRLREMGMLTPIFNWWELIKTIDPDVVKKAATVPNAKADRISKTRGVETAVAMALLPKAIPPDSLRVIYSKELFGGQMQTNFFSGVVFRGVKVPMPLMTRESAEYGEIGTNATPELGQKILDEVVDFIVGFSEEIKKHPVP